MYAAIHSQGVLGCLCGRNHSRSRPWHPTQTTESLLHKEREAREAATKEVLQYKLLLAEAEEAQASTQQQLQSILARATREAATVTELRGQVEQLQVCLEGGSVSGALRWSGDGWALSTAMYWPPANKVSA